MTGPQPPSRNSSLILVLLTLLAGVALGWLLRDTLRGPADVAVAPTADQRPTSNDQREVTDDRRPTEAHATEPPIPMPVPPEPAIAPPTPIAPPSPIEPLATLLVPSPQPPAPSPQPPAAEIVAYAGHVVAEGETLETIAANGGSTPALIASYNLLDGPPQPGRALIVPRLAGQFASLESAPILVQQGRADRPWVALTLDAGASADPVSRMLQTLREHNVTITFFLTGKWIRENPDLTRQIVADGHEIANHTVNHPDLTKLDEAAIDAELADTEELARQTAGATTRPFFRPPYGAYDERVLRVVEGQGYLPIYWTLDSLDSVGEPKTPEFLLERITGKLPPERLHGAIILAHCGSEATADALPRVLDRFAEMGFEVKKVSEVLGG